MNFGVGNYYRQKEPENQLVYKASTSAQGKDAISKRKVNFAMSTTLLTEYESRRNPDLQMLPILVTSMVPVYHIEGLADSLPSLVLDRETLAAIFMGKVTEWDDEKILKENEKLEPLLRGKPITVVYRTGSAGANEMLTSALTQFSTEWRDKPSLGTSSRIDWKSVLPNSAVGCGDAMCVVQTVHSHKGGIGYVDLGTAKRQYMFIARMRNRHGNVVEAEYASAWAAASDQAHNVNDRTLTGSLVDSPAANAWPMVSFVYGILAMDFDKQECQHAAELLKLVKWFLTDPSATHMAIKHDFTVLPPHTVQSTLNRLSQVTCDGSSVAPLREVVGGGASFPSSVYKEWMVLYKHVQPGRTVKYSTSSSSRGLSALLSGELDFAGTDAVPHRTVYAANKDLQLLPSLSGCVVPIYNIDGVHGGDDKLVLDRKTLAEIFLGRL